jgi:DNA-binding NtrC family response regulator
VRVLVVEDDRIARVSLADALAREGYTVDTAEDGAAGMQQARTGQYDVIITDLRLPAHTGMEVLKAARDANPRCEVIVITAFGTIDTAVEALKLGAYDYVTKPLSPDKFLSMVRNIRQYRSVLDENAHLKRRLELFEDRIVIGESPAMRKLLETARHVAQHSYTVLIQGESGTGKEMVARTLHYYSPRRDRPFVAINCAAIPESLLESELFGHEKGSFSGAVQRHRGYFERADGGTIFIDDIDDLPLAPQVKLLRVLQERSFLRLGGSDTVSVDVRVICATKVDLQEHVRRKLFREDLFYRLNIVPLHIPPLRERREDVPLLVRHFFEKHGAADMVPRLDAAFHDSLAAWAWPGNVRELENLVQRIIATGDSGITPGVASARQPGPAPGSAGNAAGDLPAALAPDGAEPYPSFDEYMRLKERDIIAWALARSGQNVTQAARLLDMPRGTLRSRLEKLGIDLPQG